MHNLRTLSALPPEKQKKIEELSGKIFDDFQSDFTIHQEFQNVIAHKTTEEKILEDYKMKLNGEINKIIQLTKEIEEKIIL